ncbi:MAG: hypothetical protein M1824_002464 [Vezdaea acicularis]|nr:MAG: hypothetical protein M1824_002464 [Vezdaea acicularis]
MAGKKNSGENSKKASGNAKKAEAAAQKAASENAKKAIVEDEEWGKGAKSNAKKEAAEQKKAEAARKKAEKDALLAEEEKALPTAKKGNAKTAPKKSKGLDLSQLDDSDPTSKASALNATGIDNALDALSLTADNTSDNVDRHPERRFPAAWAKFKAQRTEELKEEQPGLRKQQREDLAYKEFQKHPDNPHNQVNAKFDTTKEELREIKEREREKVEKRLVEK